MYTDISFLTNQDPLKISSKGLRLHRLKCCRIKTLCGLDSQSNSTTLEIDYKSPTDTSMSDWIRKTYLFTEVILERNFEH